MIFYFKHFSELNTTELYEIIKSRNEIFLLEQNIRCQDLDGVDYKSYHAFLWENNRVIAYLRVFYEDEQVVSMKMGRVLTLSHKIGLGTKLMNETISLLKEKVMCKEIILHSQKHAVGFYEKFGFKIVSNEYLEEGIPHLTMKIEL